MGNVQVQYKQRRDGNEAGTEVTDPKDFFKMLLGDQQSWQATKALYEEMPADKQAAFKAAFGGAEVFSHQVTAAAWLTEIEDEEDDLQEAYQKVKTVMASCPSASQSTL